MTSTYHNIQQILALLWKVNDQKIGIKFKKNPYISYTWTLSVYHILLRIQHTFYLGLFWGCTVYTKTKCVHFLKENKFDRLIYFIAKAIVFFNTCFTGNFPSTEIIGLVESNLPKVLVSERFARFSTQPFTNAPQHIFWITLVLCFIFTLIFKFSLTMISTAFLPQWSSGPRQCFL